MFWEQTLHPSSPLRGHDKHKLWKQLRKHQWGQNGPREKNIVQISSSQTPWELCVEGAQTAPKLVQFSHITKNQSVTKPEVETTSTHLADLPERFTISTGTFPRGK